MSPVRAAVLAELDHFYFQEIPQVMHPTLHGLAADLRLLQGAAEARQITTLEGLYNSSYQYLPYLLNDIFGLPENTVMQVEKGWLLLLISYVMLDQLVDRQMPAMPVVPLVQQHLLLKAHEAFAAVFPASAPFWGQYYALLHEFFTCLALESHYLDAEAAPYTYERMTEVCTGKAAPLQIVVAAMSELSGQPRHAPLLRQVFNRLVLSDQLFDDAADWEDDLVAGRRTLPYVLAQQAAQSPVTDPAALAQIIQRSGLLPALADRAIGLLEEGRDLLRGAGLSPVQLDAALDERKERIQLDRRRYQAVSFLGSLSALLEKSSEGV
jgi:hypothetical protein